MNPSDRPATPPPSSDDSLGRGLEFALVALIFLGIGLAVDSVLGTRPMVTIGAVVFAFVAQFVRMHYVYSERMRRLEDERIASTQAAGVPRATVAPVTTFAEDTLPTGTTLDGRPDSMGSVA